MPTQTSGFKGGLLDLLGVDPPPVSQSMELMRKEHSDVKEGFGTSTQYFTTSNYGGNSTTTQAEYLHVVDPENAPPVPRESSNGEAVSFRERKPFEFYVKNMGALIATSFAKIPGVT